LAPIDLRTTSFEPFLATHHHVLLYESSSPSGGSAKTEALQAIANAGFRFKSVAVDVGGTLYEYEQ
jgi:predicted NAD/FAD-binding protein